MKRTYLVLIITMLVVGFAAVATNLAINGTINFGFNQNDFDSNVVFTYINTMNGTATIQENGKSITFNTTKLENVDQQAIMDFDIANKSSQYDASVTIKCGLESGLESYSDYIEIKHDLGESAFGINSGETKSGRLTVTLKKAYNESLEKDINMLCTIIATAGERNTEGTYTPVVHEYEEILLNGADPVLEATSEEAIALVAETSNKKLIPVIINDDGTVTRADTTKKWYDYENQKWANAVILADGIEDPGINKEISESSIESYFVWIPKYRYKIFDMGNYDDVSEKLNDTKQSKAIEIKFGTEDTKNTETECVAPNESGQDGECEVGKWMTHPAFTSLNVNGFWVGKFETGYRDANSSTFSEENKSVTNQASVEKVIIKPDAYSWRYIEIGNSYQVGYNYQRNLDSHMIKNTEWGAIVYLTQSIYGRCLDSTQCEEVSLNGKNGTTGYSGTDIPYTNNESVAASTTNNYSGIYDMAGSYWEQTASVIKSENADTPIYGSSSVAKDVLTNKKYYDLYEYSSDQKHWKRRILGDATGELGPFNQQVSVNNENMFASSMYDDFGLFATSSRPWFFRGAIFSDGHNTGIFAFYGTGGEANRFATFRIVLAPQ